MLVQNILQTSVQAAKVAQIQNVLLNMTQVRYRKAVFFRKYKQPHFQQKLLLATCEPFEAIDRRLPSEKCIKQKPITPKPDHPYDILLAKDFAQELDEAQLVCFFQQNQMKNRDRRLIKNEFQHESLTLRFYNRDVARMCLKNTRFEPLLHFVAGYDFTILFAPDLTKIQKIIKISKKYPEIHLLAGLVEKRRFLTLKKLEELAKMPNLDQQRAILCHTLNMTQQGLLQTLSYHSSDLSRSLESHFKNSQEAKSE